MKRIPMAEALIAWTPNTQAYAAHPTAGQIRIGRLLQPDDPDFTRGLVRTGGAAFTVVRDAKGAEATARAFIDFHTVVVRDKVPVEAAHREFMKIEEYAAGVSPELLDDPEERRKAFGETAVGF